MAHDSTPGPDDLGQPRSKPRPRAGGNFELYSWLFMRGSGVLLVVLVFGHLFVEPDDRRGHHRRSTSRSSPASGPPVLAGLGPAMLWLAMLHGCNGLRTIINDYATRPNARFWLKTLLYFGAAIGRSCSGTLVIFTFDPCIDPKSTLDVCRIK